MRLKFLELQGYKTFANRTPFDLSARITAIVGPNGSGKSNIADCIRWVLGEQSYSLLRGRKTEDMIFSGSEGRPRLGMASATITFNNDDGWIPIDFNEVAVTRRAYRDGDNEYQINGQRVRLKDVNELLYPSGLAERTYTVIGQGLVDAVLSLRADERRRLFEEAAGIGLYRARREDAIRRLDATRRNLERVQDILVELTPRVSSLERQARRANEHDRAVAELRLLLREWYGFHWRQAQNELAAAQETARHQEGILINARQDQAERDKRTSQRRSSIQEFRQQLNHYHRELSELHQQRESISRDLAVADERSRLLVEQLTNADADLVDFSVQVNQAQIELDTTANEITRLQDEMQEAGKQLEAVRAELESLKSQRNQVETVINQSQQLLSELLSRQGQLKALISSHQSRRVHLNQTLEEDQFQLTQVEASLKEMEFRLESLRSAAAHAEADFQTGQNQLSQNRLLIEKTEEERNQVIEEQSGYNAELAGLNAQLEVFLQSEALLTGYTSGTRLLLEASRGGKIQGIIGALNDLLDVPAELEIAIAAALNEYIDAVIMDDDGEGALGLLTEEKSRGVLLPLRQIRSSKTGLTKEMSDAGIIGVAAEIIHFPTQWRQVVDLLLGSVLVVRDRKTARRLISTAHPDMKIVTLSGEVFHSSGPIQTFGGEAGAGKTVLSRVRQKEETRGRIDSAEKRLAKSMQRLQTVENHLGELRLQESSLAQIKENLEKAFRETVAETNQLELAYRGAAHRADLLKEQIDRQGEEIRKLDEETQSHEQELKTIDLELEKGRSELRRLQALSTGFPLQDAEGQVSYWITQQAIAESHFSAFKNRKQERQSAVDRLIQSQVAMETRRAELAQTLTSLAQEGVHLHQQEGIVAEKIKEQQAMIDPLEADLGNLEAEFSSTLEAETAHRQRISMAEQANAQARINLDRRQEALESLRRRIEDDFGLVAFDYVQEISGPTPLPFQGMVEELPSVVSLPPDIEEVIHRQRLQIRRLGPINPEAQAEFAEVSERHEFLTSQVSDLNKAEEDVRQVIKELDELMEQEFQKAYQAVAEEFKGTFTRLFGGGSARLVLTDPDDLSSTGIDIEARLPGRRSQGLALLSGGERSLTAAALIFSLIKVSPPPFCVLDEVDAMLDEANVSRFRDLLGELSRNTQIIIITHNRNTVQVADVIYGVTMGRDSVSQVLSLKLDELGDLVE